MRDPRKDSLAARVSQLTNDCHDPEDGRFCETEGFDQDWPDEVVNTIKGTIIEMQTRFGVKVKIVAKDKLKRNAFSLVDPSVDTKTIFVSKRFYHTDHDTLYENSDYVSQNHRDSIIHEYGHVLFFTARKNGNPSARELYDYVVSKPQAEIWSKLSKYAAKSNFPFESFPEGFLRHIKGNTNDITEKIYNTLKEVGR